MYGLYLYFLGLSFRNVSRAIEPFVQRSHVAVWEWVQKFNPKQIYPCKRVSAFLIDETMVQIGNTKAWLWHFHHKLGYRGSVDLQSLYGGIAVDSKGNVYVVDRHNNRIQKFDSDGNFTTKWGGIGSGVGEFKDPMGIAGDSSSGYVYVADSQNYRIHVFAPTSK